MTPSKHLITVIGLLAECLCISALFVWGVFSLCCHVFLLHVSSVYLSHTFMHYWGEFKRMNCIGTGREAL